MSKYLFQVNIYHHLTASVKNLFREVFKTFLINIRLKKDMCYMIPMSMIELIDIK